MNILQIKAMESQEIVDLTNAYLAAGGKIEVIPYNKPTPADVKALGFMREFEREVEYET